MPLWKTIAHCSHAFSIPAVLLLAACAQTVTQTEAPAEPQAIPRGERVSTPTPEGPPATVEQARGDCWMRYEKDKSARNLDVKLALVEKCVAEKMKGG